MSNELDSQTRRKLLQTTGASLATVVAGCLGGDQNTDQQEPEPEPEPEPQTQQSQDQGRPDLPHETRDDNQLTTEYIPTHKQIVDDFTNYRVTALSGASTTAGYTDIAEIKVDGNQLIGNLEQDTPEHDPLREFRFYQENPNSNILVEEENNSSGEIEYHIIDPNSSQSNDYLEKTRQLAQRSNHAELTFPTEIHEDINGLEHAINQMPYIHEEKTENPQTGQPIHIYSWESTANNDYPGDKGLDSQDISDFSSGIAINDETGHLDSRVTEYEVEDLRISRFHYGQLFKEDVTVERPSFADRAEATN